MEGNSLQQIEMDALLLSLRNCNQPRLIAEDAQVMKLLLHDMFSIKQENQNEHNKVLQVPERLLLLQYSGIHVTCNLCYY